MHFSSPKRLPSWSGRCIAMSQRRAFHARQVFDILLHTLERQPMRIRTTNAKICPFLLSRSGRENFLDDGLTVFARQRLVSRNIMKLPVVLPPKNGSLLSFSPYHYKPETTASDAENNNNNNNNNNKMRAMSWCGRRGATISTTSSEGGCHDGVEDDPAGRGRQHRALLLEQSEAEIFALLHTELSYLTVGQVVLRRGRPPSEWRRKIGQWAYRVIDHFGV
jgi:hypothetical protein